MSRSTYDRYLCTQLGCDKLAGALSLSPDNEAAKRLDRKHEICFYPAYVIIGTPLLVLVLTHYSRWSSGNRCEGGTVTPSCIRPVEQNTKATFSGPREVLYLVALVFVAQVDFAVKRSAWATRKDCK